MSSQEFFERPSFVGSVNFNGQLNVLVSRLEKPIDSAVAPIWPPESLYREFLNCTQPPVGGERTDRAIQGKRSVACWIAVRE